MSAGQMILDASDAESIASRSVSSGLNEFRKHLVHRIPSSRKRTRRAITVIHKTGNLSGLSGVVFPSSLQVPAAGTKTAEIVTRIWNDSREAVLLAIANSLDTSFSKMRVPTTLTISSKG